MNVDGSLFTRPSSVAERNSYKPFFFDNTPYKHTKKGYQTLSKNVWVLTEMCPVKNSQIRTSSDIHKTQGKGKLDGMYQSG